MLPGGFERVTVLLVSGGQERVGGFEKGEGRYYGAARLLRLDTDRGDWTELASRLEGGAHYPAEDPNLEFTAGWAGPGELWLPTDTEVYQYRYPDMTVERVVSYPAFHNIHHVAVFGDRVAVVSTGLDLIVLLDRATLEPVEYLNAEGRDPWHRFDPGVDYRLVHSTRPHDCHPNYVFELQGELWVTRCTQEDAVCLREPDRRIDISREKAISVHDGIMVQDLLAFTQVDGVLTLVDPDTLQVVEDVDLLKLEGRSTPRGWCRGLCYIDGILYVGFSRLRRTRNRARLRWLGRFGGRGGRDADASVAAYDLAQGSKVGEWTVPAGSLDAIYGIMPEPSLRS